MQSSVAMRLHPLTLSSKYGHFWHQKKQDGGGHKVKLKALETALHKPVGDITLTLGPVVSYRAEAWMSPPLSPARTHIAPV